MPKQSDKSRLWPRHDASSAREEPSAKKRSSTEKQPATKKRPDQRGRKCEYCANGIVFRSPALLKIHIIDCHKQEMVSCLLCEESFNNYAPYDTIRKHYSRQHHDAPLLQQCLEIHKNEQGSKPVRRR